MRVRFYPFHTIKQRAKQRTRLGLTPIPSLAQGLEFCCVSFQISMLSSHSVLGFKEGRWNSSLGELFWQPASKVRAHTTPPDLHLDSYAQQSCQQALLPHWKQQQKSNRNWQKSKQQRKESKWKILEGRL